MAHASVAVIRNAAIDRGEDHHGCILYTAKEIVLISDRVLDINPTDDHINMQVLEFGRLVRLIELPSVVYTRGVCYSGRNRRWDGRAVLCFLASRGAWHQWWDIVQSATQGPGPRDRHARVNWLVPQLSIACVSVSSYDTSHVSCSDPCVVGPPNLYLLTLITSFVLLSNVIPHVPRVYCHRAVSHRVDRCM